MAMQSSSDNPQRNVLGPGILDTAVLEAIRKSGYPLQTITAEKLCQAFHVREEWSYIDRDTKSLRTIDILASQRLYDVLQDHLRVRPQLDLIIECKKSEMPFIFFASRHRPWLSDFPILAGLRHKHIQLFTDDDLSTTTLPVLRAFGLDPHSFCTSVPISNTFSKCARRGSELELSGEDSYNSVVLPLIKAISHFEKAEEPRPSHMYFDAHLTVPIAVVDAPMIFVETNNGVDTTTFMPWVRVSRHEYDRESDDWQKDRLWAIDVVHIDFLDTYINQHLLPFAKEFAAQTIIHSDEMVSGKGYAAGLGADSWTNLKQRIHPKPITRSASRGIAIFFRIMTFPYWLWKDRKA